MSGVVRVLMALALAVTTSACAGGSSDPADEMASEVDRFYEERPRIQLRDRRALVVSQGGRVVLERYFNDSDASTTADVFSVTKSVMATLVGVAVDQGLLTLDDTLAELLPQYTEVMSDRAAVFTVREVLTMTAGFPEDDVAGPTGLVGPDGIAAVLSAPPAAPGPDFAYSSAGSHVLSAILVQATDRPVLEYARQVLFDPMGISTEPAFEPIVDLNQHLPDQVEQRYEEADFAWPKDAQGRHLGYDGLKLTARDMVALGQLYLGEGRFNDTQIVSSAWITEATHPHVPTGFTQHMEHYGYQWWTTEADGHTAFVASGHGGQHIEVVPDLDLVVVASSTVEKYSAVDPRMYVTLVDEVIAPLVEPDE